MHTLIGAGKADGAMDASNLIKPELARGTLHCVGATTLDEYRKHVEKDAALARRFQPVFVGEPSVEDTISILRGIKEKYELHHGVRIADAALVAAATLSNRYITDRFLPDKAIDLIDEASSRLRMQVDSKPEELDELDRRVIQLKIEREALLQGKRNRSGLEGPAAQAGDTNSPSCPRDRSNAMTAAWKAEKDRLVDRPEAEGAAGSGAQSRWRWHSGNADWAGASELAPRCDPGPRAAHGAVSQEGGKLVNEAVDRGKRSPRWWRVGPAFPVEQDAGRRARQADPHGRRTAQAGHRAGGGIEAPSLMPCVVPVPGCRIPTGRSAASCSLARPASARPN